MDRRDSDPGAGPKREYELAAIAVTGFTHVRVPVRWWGRAGEMPPYRRDPNVAGELDLAIDQALRRGSGVVLSMHHADGVMSAAPEQVGRVCAIWRPVAASYAPADPSSPWICSTNLATHRHPTGGITSCREF
ncbi:cellulase family glycosylhydrolase [Microbacterium pygmaeum]|uniref:cellulase family glycosylhydrolase n=1 Tax=Microbacterium pygmaeum TaxID=370764 RepID=UPI0038B2D559